MAGFSAEWLALREPADHAARSVGLTRAALDGLPRHGVVRILDLAAGTGSNLRYLTAVRARSADASSAATPAVTAPRVGTDPDVPVEWLLVDHDPALLARVPPMPGVRTRCLDLASLDAREIFDGCALVTASALLDLVSEAWVRALAARCARSGAAVLFALSYDGRIVCAPEDRDDDAVFALVNDHQRTDKGFGRALGPDAAGCAERVFAGCGYGLERASSEWALPPESAALQQRLIDGWAQAATATAPSLTARIDDWRRRRLAHVAAGRSEIVVGHQDLAGTLRS